MYRLEIIANNSVEENLLDALKAQDAGKYYTKIPNVHGIGTSGPRMGDAIWPEENFVFVIWCEEDEARRVKTAVDKVKAQFPDEGVKLFGLNLTAAAEERAAPAPAKRNSKRGDETSNPRILDGPGLKE